MPEALELTRHICLLAVAVTCVYTDLARGKLYNAVTISGLALGLVLAFLLDANMPGISRLRAAAIGAALGGGLLFLLYLAGGLGAGDVKLMAAVGALGGSWDFVLLALMYTALVGATIAIGILIWQNRLLQGLKDSARTLFTFRARKRNGQPAAFVPYGLAIGIGTIWAWIEMFAM